MKPFLISLLVLSALSSGPALPAAADADETFWALEAGSGFAFVYPHPQLRLWYRPLGTLELGAGWSTGINNFEVWSQNLSLQVRYSLPLHPQLRPWASLGAGLSLFEHEGRQTRPSAALGLGGEWNFLPRWGLSAGLQLLLPDPYSNAPFVFRPEVGLRWFF